MGRAITSSFWKFMHIKPGTIVFKSKHVISKDVLIIKYKKIKKARKNKNLKEKSINNINDTKPMILKSIKNNDNQCYQNTGKLIFSDEIGIIKINLDSITISRKKEYSDKEMILCAIPDQKYFCIDFDKEYSFIIDHNFSISQIKNINSRLFCVITYLDGIIYAFGRSNKINTYDLKANKWRKSANLVTRTKRDITSCVSFEAKIIIARYWGGNIRAFDPFSNSISKILGVKPRTGIALFVAENKLYCIQTGNWVFESLPKDCFQWHCIGKNSIAPQLYSFPQYSLYNGSMYFVGILQSEYLFQFNLKTRHITYIARVSDYD